MTSKQSTNANTVAENQMLQGLLDGLDDSIFDWEPSPVKEKPKLRRANSEPSPTKKRNTAIDFSALLEGAESWDWDDMDVDVDDVKVFLTSHSAGAR